MNKTDPYGFTALMAAVQNAEDDIYYSKRLIKLGAEVNATSIILLADHRERFDFVSNGSDSTVKSINCNDVRAAGACVNHVAGSGWTALMFAALEGHAGMMTSLIESGACVNAVTSSGHSAVTIAMVFDHCECIQLLAQNEADVNFRVQGRAGKSALSYAV